MAGRWLGFISLIVLVPVLLGGAVMFLHLQGYFNLTEIDVQIDESVLQDRYVKPQRLKIEKALELARGNSLWLMDLNQLQKEVQKLESVERVSLTRQWPAGLRAQVKLYDVKMLLMTKKGEFSPVIENGKILESSELKHLPEAAILRGENFKKNSELRQKALSIWEKIPSEGSFSRSQVSEIVFKEKEGFWLRMVGQGIEVKIGHDQVALKSGRISQVLDYLQSHQFEARVIDADLSQKVLVRLRKDP